ncbi:MAG: thioredoxin family protein [Thermoplasmata archaeon]|nr:thioredoxin family protein [Thermoplasmata archaeon]
MEQLTPTDFDGARLHRPGTVVVCFWASWCGFCRRFLPSFVAKEGRVGATLALASVEEDENPLWEVFQIEAIPTIIAFREGALVWRIDSPLMVGLDDRALTTMEERLRAPPTG